MTFLQTLIYLATSDEAARSSGLYWELSSKTIFVKVWKYKDAQRLWQLSEGMCGIKNYFEVD
jgi:hypothetical protein